MTSFEQQAQAIAQQWYERQAYHADPRFDSHRALLEVIAAALTACAAQTREECAKVAENVCTDNIHHKPLACSARTAAALRAQEPPHA